LAQDVDSIKVQTQMLVVKNDGFPMVESVKKATNPRLFWRLDWLFPVVEIRWNLWAPT